MLFAALTVALYRRAWSAPASTWIGAAGDPPTYMWFLKWTPWALARGENPFSTTHVNFPDGVNMMWNNAEPLIGILAAPVTWLFGIVPAYNVVLTAGVALSGWCAYLVLRRHVRSPVAAAVGGLVYGFSPYVVSQSLTHSNLVWVMVLPLLMPVAEEILVRQRRTAWRTGGLLGTIVGLQLLVGEEYVVYGVLAVVLSAVLLAVGNPRRVSAHLPHVVRCVAAGVVVALAIAGWPLAHQFLGPDRVTEGVLHPTAALSADALAFVVPTEHQQLEPAWARDVTARFTDACCVEEQGSYLGAGLLVLMVVAAVRWRRRAIVLVPSLVGAVFLVLSMGSRLHLDGSITFVPLPFAWFDSLPVVGNVIPRRLVLVTWLAAAIIVAVWVDALLERGRPRSFLVAGWAALAVALVPLLPTFDFPVTSADVPDFFTTSAVERLPRDEVALVTPFSRDTSTSRPMLWQAEAGFRYRMPAGYILGADDEGRFSFLPVESTLSLVLQDIQQGKAPPELAPDLRRQLASDFRAREIASVVVGPERHALALVDFFTELLQRPPEAVGGVYLWLGVDDGVAAAPP